MCFFCFVLFCFFIRTLLAGCKENHFYSLPFGQAKASIYQPRHHFNQAPKAFCRAELISHFFCYSNSSKNITCPSGKLKQISLAQQQNPLAPGYRTLLSLHAAHLQETKQEPFFVHLQFHENSFFFHGLRSSLGHRLLRSSKIVNVIPKKQIDHNFPWGVRYRSNLISG